MMEDSTLILELADLPARPAQKDKTSPGALRDCGEIAVTRLAMVLSETLSQAVKHFFAKSVEGAFSPEQQAWIEAAEFARSRRQDIADAFAENLEKSYGSACRRRPGELPGALSGIDASELRLVEHDALEYAISPDGLVEAIRNGTWISLPDLTKWFRDMLADPDLLPLEMPLGPRLLGNAVTLAINEQAGRPDAKQRLNKALCRQLPEFINRFYQDLGRHLAGDPHAFNSSPAGSREATSLPARTGTPVSPASLVAAAEAIQQHLAGIRLPGFVKEFMNGPWQKILGRVHQRQGATGPAWEDALQAMQALVHVFTARKSPESFQRLTRELPALARRLLAVIEQEGERDDAQELFFKRLAEFHIGMLAKLGTGENTAATAQTAPAPDASPADTSAPDVSAPTPMAQAALLEDIETGVWLEFRERESASRKLRLSWISPNRSLFMLANQRGERALSLGPRDLADLLRSGSARIVSTTGSSAALRGLQGKAAA